MTRDRTRSSSTHFGSACARVPVYYLLSSVVVVGVEDRPPFSDLSCALRHRPAPVLRSRLGVAPWLPHEGLANGEGFVPPGAVLRQECPHGEHRRKELELKLELVQAHMAQETMLRVEVGARALRVRSVSREEAWAIAGVKDAWMSGCGCEAD